MRHVERQKRALCGRSLFYPFFFSISQFSFFFLFQIELPGPFFFPAFKSPANYPYMYEKKTPLAWHRGAMWCESKVRMLCINSQPNFFLSFYYYGVYIFFPSFFFSLFTLQHNLNANVISFSRLFSHLSAQPPPPPCTKKKKKNEPTRKNRRKKEQGWTAKKKRGVYIVNQHIVHTTKMQPLPLYHWCKATVNALFCCAI